MMSTINRLTPTPVRKSLGAMVRGLVGSYRRRIEAGIPKVPLTQKHVANCEVVLDRASLLEQLKPGGRIAELGVNRGDFSQQILTIARPAELHLVDVWNSARYHEGLYEEVRKKLKDGIQSHRVYLHRMLSVDAAAEFNDGFFDFVYIDTNHTYTTTHAELVAFAKKVKPGGLLAGHDYSVGNWITGQRYGVVEAVHEFCVIEDWQLRYLTVNPLEGRSFAICRL